MTARKLFVGIGLLMAVGGWASPDKPSRLVTIEPAAQQHLDSARSLTAEGKFLEAIAHAQVISLESPISLQSTGSNFDERIADASETWNRSLGLTAFAIASRGVQPDINFRFVPELRNGNTEIAGLTDWSREVWYEPDYRCQIKGLVRARTILPGGKTVSNEAMTQILLHELGHVLGLADGGDGVMGPLDPDRPILAPSQQEIRLLKVFIGEARRVRTQSSFIGVLDGRGVH